MHTWKGDIKSPLVSICCVTYNHEKYIAEAIESFLMQETNFPFEILIADDCSPDETADIIRTYANKFPNIIKANLRIKNIGGKANFNSNLKRAKSKYIALCEGDDYWTDKEKLQFQISKMKEHNDCQISFHPAKILRNRIVSDEVTARHLENDTVFDVKEIIKGDGGFCPTASIIFKKEVLENPPYFFKDAPVGDYFLQVLGSIDAGALYIDRTMSIYRIHPKSVWTSTARDYKALKLFISKMSKSLDEMNKYYNGQYNKEIEFIKSSITFRSLNKDFFHINERIDLYDTYKLHLSAEQLSEIQQRLISDQTKMINEQKKIIDDKEKSCKKLLSDIELANNNLNILLRSAQKIAQIPITKHPIKKYKAYKEMLVNIIKR